jgi:hypothetical protein
MSFFGMEFLNDHKVDNSHFERFKQSTLQKIWPFWVTPCEAWKYVWQCGQEIKGSALRAGDFLGEGVFFCPELGCGGKAKERIKKRTTK